MNNEQFFTLGYIVKAKGLKGELQLKIEADRPEEYLNEESVFLEIKGRPVPFFVSAFRLHPGKKSGLLLLEDIDTVEKAQALKGVTVLLPAEIKKEGEPLPFSSLQGYQVIDRTAGPIGTIREIIQYPGHSVAALEHEEREILLPLNEDFIERIDKQSRQLFVNLPEGLLEIYLD